mgnify:CR=1 FL=1
MNNLNLPWMMSIEEFRKTGDFRDWTDEAIEAGIETLAKLAILSFELKKKTKDDPRK